MNLLKILYIRLKSLQLPAKYLLLLGTQQIECGSSKTKGFQTKLPFLVNVAEPHNDPTPTFRLLQIT